MNGTGATRVCGVHGTALQLPSLAALTFGPCGEYDSDDNNNHTPLMQWWKLERSYNLMEYAPLHVNLSDDLRGLRSEASIWFGPLSNFYHYIKMSMTLL